MNQILTFESRSRFDCIGFRSIRVFHDEDHRPFRAFFVVCMNPNDWARIVRRMIIPELLSIFIQNASGVTYSIFRVSDLRNYDHSAMTSSNTHFTQRFQLNSSNGLVVPDLGIYFYGFSSSDDIHAMSITQLADGRFVIVANRRDSSQGRLNDINIITTRDFKSFTPSWIYDTPYGAGHSIKLGQPFKNGSSPITKLHMFHGGDLDQSDGVIRYSYFNFYRATLP